MKLNFLYKCILCFYIVFETNTWVQAHTHLRMYVPAVVCFIGFALTGGFAIFKHRASLICLGTHAMILCAHLCGYDNSPVTSNFGHIFAYSIRSCLPFWLFMDISERRDYRLARIVFYVAVCAIIITMVQTLMGMSENAYIAREMAGARLDTLEGMIDMYEAKQVGIGSYYLYHCFAFFYPIFIFLLYKTELKPHIKVFLSLTLVLMIFTGIRASFATALLLSLFSIVIAIFLSNKNRMVVFPLMLTLVCVCVLYCCIDERTIGKWLINASSLFRDTAIEGKLIDAADGILVKTHQTQSDGRLFLYTLSAEQFIRSPFFGCRNYYLLGGHSWVIDSFAYFGLIIFLPIFLPILFSLKYIKNELSKNNALSGINYGIIIGCFIVFSCVKSFYDPQIYFFIFLIVPCGLFVPKKVLVWPNC